MFTNISPLPTLFPYPGPYKVGTVEVEIPVTEISTAGRPSHNISTIKFRLFYPTPADSVSKDPVYWLAEPQKQSNEAFASFVGADSGWKSYLVTWILSVWKSVRLPAVKNAPILDSKSRQFPVCIFSHGLGGTINNYSSIAGTLASCGTICLTPEHRDGSAPITLVRNAEGNVDSSIKYQRFKHNPDVETLNARNAQLRIRVWELEQVHSVVQALNNGQSFTNYATMSSKTDDAAWRSLQSALKQRLLVHPGQITWAGHSFGAATTVQLIKSVYYQSSTPKAPKSPMDGEKSWDWTPLYQPVKDSGLSRQITEDSPVVLFDLWTMPLRGDVTKWLFDKPMPCYHRQPQSKSLTIPTIVAVMSAEFNGYTELVNRTKAVLSRNPANAAAAFETKQPPSDSQTSPSESNDPTDVQNVMPELSKQLTDSPMLPELHKAEAMPVATDQSRTELDLSLAPHLYTIPQSAHLSQSDFGVLFPNLSKMIMKAIEPQKTLQLNIRAALAVMRGRGLPVKGLTPGEDRILEHQFVKGHQHEERWVRVPLEKA